MKTYIERCFDSAVAEGNIDQIEKWATSLAMEEMSAQKYREDKARMEFDKELMRRNDPEAFAAWQQAERKAEEEAVYYCEASGNPPIFTGVVHFVDPADYL